MAKIRTNVENGNMYSGIVDYNYIYWRILAISVTLHGEAQGRWVFAGMLQRKWPALLKALSAIIN